MTGTVDRGAWRKEEETRRRGDEDNNFARSALSSGKVPGASTFWVINAVCRGLVQGFWVKCRLLILDLGPEA